MHRSKSVSLSVFFGCFLLGNYFKCIFVSFITVHLMNFLDLSSLCFFLKKVDYGFAINSLSSDGKYILTGGEDDLVQVWSTEERKIVACGEGHNSWVSLSCSQMSNGFNIHLVTYNILIS